MNKEQILKIIEGGESQEVEFKQSFHSSQEFSKIMCGLANTFGGIILIGVSPKKESANEHQKSRTTRRVIETSKTDLQTLS